MSLFLVACNMEVQETMTETDDIPQKSGTGTSILDNEIKTTADGTKYIIHPNDIRGGGPPKGGIGNDRGIPALAKENIKFVTVAEADKWIEDDELVLALIHKEIKRVYPLQVLVFHELVNDNIAGDPLLITYCPLCGSGIAYEPFITIDGEKTYSRFGTSGKLYNSNLVMYDEETDTYWQQIDGKAIVGELTGQELKEISIDTVTWKEWKAVHPDSEVLSKDTGIDRPYGRDPYGGYYENDFLFFPVDNEDESIHPKTVIFGVEVDNKYIAYKEEDVLNGIINDKANGITVTRGKDGLVKVMKGNTELIKERDFFFAWYAFHPDTEVYGVTE